MIGGFLDGINWIGLLLHLQSAVTDFTTIILGKLAGEVDAVIDQAMKPIQRLAFWYGCCNMVLLMM